MDREDYHELAVHLKPLLTKHFKDSTTNNNHKYHIVITQQDFLNPQDNIIPVVFWANEPETYKRYILYFDPNTFKFESKPFHDYHGLSAKSL